MIFRHSVFVFNNVSTERPLKRRDQKRIHTIHNRNKILYYKTTVIFNFKLCEVGLIMMCDVLFPSVNNFFTRHPVLIFEWSTFSESILDQVGATE